MFWEHVLILLMFLPLLIRGWARCRKIKARTWGYLIFSGIRWLGRRHNLFHARAQAR